MSASWLINKMVDEFSGKSEEICELQKEIKRLKNLMAKMHRKYMQEKREKDLLIATLLKFADNAIINDDLQ